MHASLVIAGAFAIGTAAMPSAKHAHLHHHEKKDVVYVTDYATEVVATTVVVDATPAPDANYGAPAPKPRPQKPKKKHHPKPKNDVHAEHYGGDNSGWGNWPSWGKKGNDNNQGGWSYFWSSNPREQKHEQPQQYEQPQPKPEKHEEYQAPEVKPKPKPKPQPKPQQKPETEQKQDNTPSNAANDYQKNILDSHNLHRANHSSPKLQWDNALANAAALLANTCNWGHNTDLGKEQCKWGGYGQNLAAGTQKSQVAKVVNDMWYNGEITLFEGMYGQSDPTSNFEGWGHFSQLIWKDTTHVGCATVDCNGKGDMSNYAQPPIYTVCNYGPAGNMGGAYAQNVKKPQGQPTVAGTKCSL